MNRLLILAAMGLLAEPAFGGPEILPVSGTRYASYDIATGELTPTPGPTRYGDSVWAATYDSGWYVSNWDEQEVLLDWGDCGDPADPYTINGFAFGYATETCFPEVFDAIIWFFAEENGWNSFTRVPLAGFVIEVPGGACPDYNGWVVTVDLEDTGYEFDLDGSDMDADGLVDFGYTYWWRGLPAGDRTGPHLSGDPNELLRPPGAENAFDVFLPPDDANMPDGSVGLYLGTYWYSGPPYLQFYMELYGAYVPVECPNPGNSGRFCTGDIDDSGDCLVGLNDLAKLLSNYGVTSGAERLDGDLEPYPEGDGDVDLADLAELLSQYGDDCN